jgi:hypothetical protein
MNNDHLNQCTMQCPSISWFYGKITSGMFKWFRVWIENDSSKMSHTQLLCSFQKGKDLKLEIGITCNHCTKFMV